MIGRCEEKEGWRSRFDKGRRNNERVYISFHVFSSSCFLTLTMTEKSRHKSTGGVGSVKERAHFCDFFGFYSGYLSGLSGGFLCYEIHPEIIEKEVWEEIIS